MSECSLSYLLSELEPHRNHIPRLPLEDEHLRRLVHDAYQASNTPKRLRPQTGT